MAEIVLCRREELPPVNEAREVTAEDRVFCVANIAGAISVMDNVCIHRGGPLGQGLVEGGKIVCPWHGWAFDPKTGAAAHNPQARTRVYPSRLVGDELLVLFNEVPQ